MALILCAGLALWIAADLYLPHHGDLRKFDPVAVAHFETGMWRAYYDHRSLPLFLGLAALLRNQYEMPFWRSCLTAYHAAKAAIEFQRGHNRSEYELALPDLIAYYGLILRSSSGGFRPREAARLELEWWIVHRERDRRPAGDLETALAALQSEIYQLPASRFEEHARARAEAMRLRDRQASAGLSPADWNRIEQLLQQSWSSLHAQFT